MNEQTNDCAKCREAAEFGYKIEGAMQWFCAEHRLAKHYADRRVRGRYRSRRPFVPARRQRLQSTLGVSAFLARPSTPETARQDVIERAASGEPFSHQQVKDTISEARRQDHEASPDNPKAKHKPSYVPDDIIDKIVVQFKGLAQNDQHRCVRRLSGILRGETS